MVFQSDLLIVLVTKSGMKAIKSIRLNINQLDNPARWMFGRKVKVPINTGFPMNHK
jgi:hypothetical protein